jgi:hypothetical protein
MICLRLSQPLTQVSALSDRLQPECSHCPKAQEPLWFPRRMLYPHPLPLRALLPGLRQATTLSRPAALLKRLQHTRAKILRLPHSQSPWVPLLAHIQQRCLLLQATRAPHPQPAPALPSSIALLGLQVIRRRLSHRTLRQDLQVGLVITPTRTHKLFRQASLQASLAVPLNQGMSYSHLILPIIC